MKKVKSILSLVLAALLFVSAFAVPASASGFPDVYSFTTYLDAINYVSDNGLMVGEENGYFNPNNSLTRAMCVMVLYKMAGRPHAYSGQSFSDVPTTAWYYDAVQWAVSEGITSGTGGGKFEPNKAVIRQDAMRFLYLYATQVANVTISRSATITGYSDYSSVSDYAKTAVAWAIGNKLLDPKPASSKTIAPKTTITRRELAYAVTNFGTNVERLRTEDILSFENEADGNSNVSFSQTYYMSANHKSKYENKLKAKYGTGDSYENAWADSKAFLKEKPIGRCFGMSAVTALDKYGKIAFNENVGYGVSNMNSVVCTPGSDTESMITYYHMAQRLSFLDIEKVGKTSIGTVLNELRTASGLTMLSAIYFTPKGSAVGHAVLVSSCEYKNGNYILNLYDPNAGAITTWTVAPSGGIYYISSNDSFAGSHFYSAYAVTDFGSSFDFLDIDGYQNSKTYANSTNSLANPLKTTLEIEEDSDTNLAWNLDPEDFSTVYFYLEDGVTITNDRGETLTWQDGAFSGDMEIYNWNFITGTSPVLAYVDVPVSETFRLEAPEDCKEQIAVVDKYRFQYVENFTGKAALNRDGTIKIESADADSKIEAGFYSYATGDELCKVSGRASQSVALNLRQNTLKVDGLLGEYTVTKTDKNKNETVSTHKPETDLLNSAASSIFENNSTLNEVKE